MITVSSIKDLERKYMDEIWELVSGKDFISDLREIEEYIQTNYIDLDRNFQIKNKLQLAAERLLSFYIHKKFKVTKIYPSPLSSDIAFFTQDCLINIDAKTIDLSGNKGDDNYIQFCPHQISFENNNLHKNKINETVFNGTKLQPGLPEIEPKTKLPCLTFFMGITYKDDGKSFIISHIKLSCIPNGKIVKEEFDNNLVQNFKTYRYLKKDAAGKFDNKYVPKKTSSSIPQTWIPFKLNSKGKGKNDTWLDTSLSNPFNPEEFAVWRILDKKYHICLGGDTARIKPEILRKRKDGSGNEWLGIRELNFVIPIQK